MKEDFQEFEKLRKLLVLKSREMPPPGYFNGFSDTVINRIEIESVVQSGVWEQVVSLFKARPAISWSFSVAAVLVLFVASNSFDGRPNQEINGMPALAKSGASPAAASMMLSTNFNPPSFSPARLALEPVPSVTNVEPKLDSLFSTPFYHQVQPASYTQ